MKVLLDVPDDVLCAVVEGAHIRYWARDVRFSPSALLLVLREREGDDGDAITEPIRVDAAGFELALARMAAMAPAQFGRLIAGDWDADTGDVLVQLACFGDVKYG